jgi:hypothetical protein
VTSNILPIVSPTITLLYLPVCHRTVTSINAKLFGDLHCCVDKYVTVQQHLRISHLGSNIAVVIDLYVLYHQVPTVKSSTVGIPLRNRLKGNYDTLGGVIQQPYINQCSLLFGGRYIIPSLRWICPHCLSKSDVHIVNPQGIEPCKPGCSFPILWCIGLHKLSLSPKCIISVVVVGYKCFVLLASLCFFVAYGQPCYSLSICHSLSFSGVLCGCSLSLFS